MIKYVFFDFDGVLHNTFQVHLEEIRTFFACNLSEQEYRDMHNGNFHEHTVAYLDGVDWFAYRDHVHDRIASLVLDEDMAEVVSELSKTYTLAIVSSGGEKHIQSFLEKNNVREYFGDILGVEFHTSKKEKFSYLLKKYELFPNEVFFVTDTLGDITEASDVGIPTIAVTFGFHDRETLEKGDPMAVIDHPKELLKIIKNI